MTSVRRAPAALPLFVLAVFALAACGSQEIVSVDTESGPVAAVNSPATAVVSTTTSAPTTSVPVTTIGTTTTSTPATTTSSSTTTSTTSTTSTTTTTTLPPTTQPPQTLTVDISDLSFEPTTITIAVGDRVSWRNQGIIQHTATGSFWDTGAIDSGGNSSTVTFDQAGSYDYVCTFHSGQTGIIVVQEP